MVSTVRQSLGNEIRDQIHDYAGKLNIPMTLWQAAKITEHLIAKYKIIPHEDWPWIEGNILMQSRG
jgi:hypothetical protein